MVVSRGKFATTYQKHYPDLGSDTSLAWNFCARSSDVMKQRKPLVTSKNVGCFLRLCIFYNIEGKGRKEGRKEGVMDDRTTDVPSSKYILTCEQ